MLRCGAYTYIYIHTHIYIYIHMRKLFGIHINTYVG